MKNTLENKAKFFAQYLGQRVLLWHEHSPFFNLLVEDFKSDTFSNYRLQLTPLSQITDEDALEVGKIHNKRYSVFYGGINRTIEIGKEVASEINSSLGIGSLVWVIVIEIIDFLRSQGYALPWMGLSVEQLVSFGWVKLTS